MPPGIADATVPNPIFSLTPAATVDEGNNWINMRFGPLALSNPTLLPEVSPAAPVAPASAPNINSYGNYGLTGMSTNSIGTANLTAAPTKDFFGTARSGRADIGAVEYQGSVATTSSATLTPTTWAISHARNCPGTTLAQRLACGLDPSQSFTLTNTGTATLTGITAAVLGGDSGRLRAPAAALDLRRGDARRNYHVGARQNLRGHSAIPTPDSGYAQQRAQRHGVGNRLGRDPELHARRHRTVGVAT